MESVLRSFYSSSLTPCVENGNTKTLFITPSTGFSKQSWLGLKKYIYFLFSPAKAGTWTFVSMFLQPGLHFMLKPVVCSKFRTEMEKWGNVQNPRPKRQLNVKESDAERGTQQPTYKNIPHATSQKIKIIFILIILFHIPYNLLTPQMIKSMIKVSRSLQLSMIILFGTNCGRGQYLLQLGFYAFPVSNHAAPPSRGGGDP